MLFVFLFLAIGVSFLCSLLEAVLLTVSHAHVRFLNKSGSRAGKLLKKQKAAIDKPLAAILTLNTIANTVGAAGVGVEVLRNYGDQWVALASGILTLLILVVSEIIPKTLGATYWRYISPYAAYIIQVLIFFTYPIVIILESLAQFVVRRKPHYLRITLDDLMLAAEIGESEGVLNKKETRVIKNLLMLRETLAKDVMTPRSVVFALPKSLTVGQVIKRHKDVPFSRIPIFNKKVDDIDAKVFRDDILQAFSQGKLDRTLSSFGKPIHHIPFSQPVASVLDEFISRREHMFVVHDEHGGVAGIITLEDAIETLLGEEILDESDSIADMRLFAREKWAKKRKAVKLATPKAKNTDDEVS